MDQNFGLRRRCITDCFRRHPAIYAQMVPKPFKKIRSTSADKQMEEIFIFRRQVFHLVSRHAFGNKPIHYKFNYGRRRASFYVNADIQDVYAIAYCDNHKFEEFIKNGRAQEFLDKSESMVVAEANGNILSEQKTTFGSYPAREFEYKAGGKANYSVKVKYVMIGQRVYSLMAVFMTGNPYPEDRTTFFNSFRLQN
jgi:tetrahydromethanopterin S-methyltransferase subunit B